MEVIANLRWRKSTFSGNGGPDCVEVADCDGRVLVRDTKQHGDGPVLQLSVAAWHRLVAGRKANQLGSARLAAAPALSPVVMNAWRSVWG